MKRWDWRRLFDRMGGNKEVPKKDVRKDVCSLREGNKKEGPNEV